RRMSCTPSATSSGLDALPPARRIWYRERVPRPLLPMYQRVACNRTMTELGAENSNTLPEQPVGSPSPAVQLPGIVPPAAWLTVLAPTVLAWKTETWRELQAISRSPALNPCDEVLRVNWAPAVLWLLMV